MPAAVAQTRQPDTAELKAKIENSPKLRFRETHFEVHPPSAGWELGGVFGVAVDANGTIYIVQRGDKADPIIALDKRGNVLRSWGKGDFTLPHSVRVDPKGNVWAVDAGASVVIEYSPSGKKLMTIAVGEAPENQGAFRGATDIAFGPDGHIFISDGYANARVLEYTADGKRVKVWGKSGTGVGEFHLPHAIQIDRHRVLYVADRENGRIEKFRSDGHFRGEIDGLGRCYSLKLANGALWATMSPFDQALGAPGWIVKLDPKSGKILGHLDVPDQREGHAIDVLPSGEPIVTAGSGLLWFRSQ